MTVEMIYQSISRKTMCQAGSASDHRPGSKFEFEFATPGSVVIYTTYCAVELCKPRQMGHVKKAKCDTAVSNMSDCRSRDCKIRS